MLNIIRIPAFRDNYIWLLHDGKKAVAVDPGDAKPVLDMLAHESLSLTAILITHHHADHQGGTEDLLARFPAQVFGPGGESITALTHPLYGGETIRIDAPNAEFQVIAVPGHTRGHLAYYGASALFCGDTLFGGGCGRLFEGTAAQMADSLSRLAALPDDTSIYCAHEYTEANLRFALAVEPGNKNLQDRVREVAEARAVNHPTIPSTLALEKATNPFLRCTQAEVVASARRRDAQAGSPAEIFAVLREWRNGF